MERLTIIMPTHKTYLDVAVLSEKLYLKYWPDCPFKIILSTNRSEVDFSLFKVLSNSDSDEYIRRIYNAAQAYASDYYLIIGEDNFISSEIDEKKIYDTINYLKENSINYCRIIPPEKKSKELRFYPIRKNKPYGITGAGFICTKEFIDKELVSNINGWQFENDMLAKTMLYTSKDYFADCIAASQDVLDTIHGIRHGMWIPQSYKKLKRLNPELDFDIRPVTDEDLSYFIREKADWIYKLIPTRTRFYIKKSLKKIGLKFATDF